MAPATIPTTEPIEVLAGLTWRWDKTLADYTPADGWSYGYAIRGAGRLDLTGVATAENDGWELTAAASDTADLPGGVYQWTAYVTSGSEKYVTGRGSLTVLPNPLTAAEGTLQLWAEQSLAYVEATLAKRYQADMAGYTIEQRQAQREELAALERSRSRLAAEVDARKSQGRFGRRVEWRPVGYR